VAFAVPLILATAALGVGSATAAAGSAVAHSTTPSSLPTIPATPAPTADPAVPELAWLSCADGFQCATATVPLDYAKPADRHISIALTRLPATDPERRIGSLFVNPGGPGGSGVDFVQTAARSAYSPQVRARFDIVGFDPRFVGASRPLATCLSDPEFADTFGSLPMFPITATQERLTHRANAHYSALCSRRSPWLAYASTANVARDLDLLRQAVGDSQLSFVGYSYGSVLGQTYAALFPERVRALVIDGVVDAELWSTGPAQDRWKVPFITRIDSATGTYDTFEQFMARCDEVGPERCALADSGDSRSKYDRLAGYLLDTPIPMDGGGQFGYPELVSATLGVLYSPQIWQEAAGLLQNLYAAVFGAEPAGSMAATSRTATPTPAAAARSAGLLRQAGTTPRWAAVPPSGAVPLSRAPRRAGLQVPPLDTSLAAFSAVSCADTINPRSAAAWASAGAAQDRANPYFGRAWTWAGEMCATWKLSGKGRYLGPYDRPTSAPLLVIGNAHDPATPYSGARSVADRIPGARLLTVDGVGHTSLAEPSACVSDVLRAYLIDGALPPPAKVCLQDVSPFPYPS
jgi:pimeloyl-ACP methyl ester carboxylesterase